MRDRLIELLQNVPTDYAGKRGVGTVADYLIDNDIIPIVRCKDCKYRGNWKCSMFTYEYHEWREDYVGIDNTEDNGFCHCGEREEELNE